MITDEVIEKIKDRTFDITEFGPFSDDKDVAMLAVEMNGLFLFYCSDRLKNDKEVVLKAIKGNGNWFIFASDKLKNDIHMVLEAVRKTPDPIIYASAEIQKLCENSDPVKTLESIINHRQLSHSILNDNQATERLKPKI